ncbi:MAG: NADH:ubiquinone reductase (Na(+)-transporting) subunit C [Bacteroidetes bacterium]|jgi:Na+-transporting NADH:ubiquinone oxidoreductase subunit C|nr:NADH:ubiquinone reductase (Na(+)-transporting) subunit C [Bacteroidota bacterium]MBT6687432.1 NADH:ubiquinone reductase (Na(+)-transporting) subunit C [Bacteroidota bacterium]MBT7142300.1 NADH:ubiquinone reductase (Na(+)-transporting) subunit C [Bacteroidota bacterium]MBT7493355.1 NADH:ubiquinone reductase (Na(+)-transporting) subunit C [Bacteroidota bacterium]
MNTNSNLYIFLYASGLVVVVAAILSFTAIKLQPYQEQNVRIEKMQNILSSVGIESTVETAESNFTKYITKSFTIGHNGNDKSGDAFNINLKKELSLDKEKMTLPVFECTQDDGSKNIIIPVRGKGLWGPIWGYISLKEDYNTIFGAVFDHKQETPGLGADINQAWFQDPFKGKKLFDDKGNFVSIKVYKGGKGAAKNAGDLVHGVDAISGGTITSVALQDMLSKDCLINFETFLKKKKN